MLIGLGTAASGLLSHSKSIDVMSNNVANSQTAGYKKDTLITSTFGGQLYSKLESGMKNVSVGNVNSGSKLDQVFTSFDQGSIEETDSKLDFAIEGNGFFTVQKSDGSTGLTRNGQFKLDENGYLISPQGGMILGQNGLIKVNQANFDVNENGQIFVNGNYVDTLKITCPTDLKALTKQTDGTFTDPNQTVQGTAFDGIIKQGSIETSNVDMTKEMAGIIASSRAFQSCSQLIKMMDQILQKSVNEIGKL
jgi:flagellar basal-body rod protein FlgF